MGRSCGDIRVYTKQVLACNPLPVQASVRKWGKVLCQLLNFDSPTNPPMSGAAADDTWELHTWFI